MSKPSQVILLAILFLCGESVRAEHIKLFVITGQSNSLGTTGDKTESDDSPEWDAADSATPFFWSNLADASTAIGDSEGKLDNPARTTRRVLP